MIRKSMVSIALAFVAWLDGLGSSTNFGNALFTWD